MSRAFVKESDDVPDLPDRPVSPHPNLVTEHGLALIDAEIARYRTALADAQGLAERTQITAASRELRYWTARRASAELQPAPEGAGTVRFGSRVTLLRQDARRQVFRIVGEDEADPAAGTLSHASPLARALLGRHVGDTVPAGRDEAEIVAIEP